MQDLRLGILSCFQGEKTDADWEIESSCSATSGIEVEHAFMLPDPGLMRMAVKHHRELGGSGVEVQGVHIVKHIDIVPFKQEHIGFRQTSAWTAAIDVTADGGDGSNC